MSKAKPKILVVGSFVMDQIATTEIFPREGQTVLGKSFHKAPGGKGANQAVQAARLGADVTMFGKLGRDGNGKEMRAVCEECGIDTSKIVYDEELASGCAVIVLEEHPGESAQNRIIVLSGSNMSITPDDVAFLKEEIAEYDLVLLQIEIPMEINVIVAQYAAEKGVPVMLNPAPSAPLPPELLKNLTYISPNEHEAKDITGIDIPHTEGTADFDAAKKAAQELQKMGVKNVLITIGSAGAVYLSGDNFYHSPAISGTVAVDPTAAGDSFVGSFATAICSGKGIEEALHFANVAASITVSSMGAMPSLPTLALVEEKLKSC